MRQINVEKDDPLKRIQEEINEVARRERELRQKDTVDDPTAHLDNMSGISDDSGISSASSPVNGMSSNIVITSNGMLDAHQVAVAGVAPVPYKRSITVGGGGGVAVVQSPKLAPMPGSPASHHMTTVGPRMTRAMSTPQIFTPSAKRFSVAGGSQKGMMQRFLASRGKYAAGGANGGGAHGVGGGGRDAMLTSLELNRSPINITPEFSPPIIERDENGRPIRRGYVPVEEKIQRELRDLKSRETELKRHNRLSKLRRSQPDLLDAVNDSMQYDSGEESAAEDNDNDNSGSNDHDDNNQGHGYFPGKLRASKSIGELCQALNAESLLSVSPCPPRSASSNANQRPAVSLAALCDVAPEEAPSSHRLIQQWESMIQQRQEIV